MSRTVPAQQWRNSLARLELGITSKTTPDDLPGIRALLEALESAPTDHPTGPGDLRRFQPIEPNPNPSESGHQDDTDLPKAFTLPAYTRLPANQSASTDNRIIVSLIRPMLYHHLTSLPAPAGQAVYLMPEQCLSSDDPEQVWTWATETLAGPRIVEADATNCLSARMPNSVLAVITAVINDHPGNLWLPEELLWLRAATGVTPKITGAWLYGDIQSSLGNVHLRPPSTVADPLNVAYGWWLESAISTYDQPDNQCRHWITHIERALSWKAALDLARQGFQITGYGLGSVSIAEAGNQRIPPALFEWAFDHQAQVLTPEGRPAIPQSVTDRMAGTTPPPAWLYTQLLTHQNPQQLVRLATDPANRPPG